MTGDQNLTQLHLDTALGQCQAYITLNSTLENEQPEVSMIVINLCPNNCSNRGVCSQGTCSWKPSENVIAKWQIYVAIKIKLCFWYLIQNNCQILVIIGNCTCDHGFGGSDCSFDVLSPPTVVRLSDDGVCDKSLESCEDITVYGHYFLENMGTSCYVTRKEVLGQ